MAERPTDLQRVVVTGGAGFIGANLARTLTATPWVGDVLVIDDLSTGNLANLDGLPVRFIEGSILDTDLLDEAFAGASAVVHLGAVPSVPRSVAEPLRSHEANATGTVKVLDAARRAGAPHVVLASSSSVYGANPKLPKSEDMRAAPLSPYAVSKLATESYALAYAACYGLEVLPFRFFNVFGPLQPPDHDYAAVVPAFISAALSGRPLRVFGDGLQTRDFTYVDTVVNTIVDAIARRVTSDAPVNLAFGTRTTLLELIAELESVLDRPLDVQHEPPRPGDVRDSQADNSRLRALFPDIAPVALREGLRRTADWMARLGAPASRS
ncbi:MAG: NAD-dependent epimerase/dehydratase family protein [bacterium]